MEPQLRVPNTVRNSGCIFLILACVLNSQAGISLLGEVNHVRARLITNRAMVLRLQGSGRSDRKAGSSTSSLHQSSLPSPVRRSGTPVAIKWYQELWFTVRLIREFFILVRLLFTQSIEKPTKKF